MSQPIVSVVIPTRNGGTRLGAVMAAIRAQRHESGIEVVIADSGSTDGTRAQLVRDADVFVEVAPESFNHGTTRNLGVASSSGELVVMLVQDALPRGDRWLASLVAPLCREPDVAGAFARQVPGADASPLMARQLAGWVAGRAEPRTTRLRDRAEYDSWTPNERLQACAFDNVCSVIRRSVWELCPFRELPIAEDLAWGRDALLAGHAIAYTPNAIVEHSHNRSAWYELKRTWVLHQQLQHLFGIRTVPSIAHLARAMASTTIAHQQWLRDERRSDVRSRLHGQALALAWPLGQYLGGLTAASGLERWRPAGV